MLIYFKQSKKLLLEKLRDLRDTLPRHWSLCFFYHVTYRTPCHASDHLVIFTASATYLRERFLLSGIFLYFLHSFLLVSRPPWGRQFNLKVSRVSCWYVRNIALARLFVWITTIRKGVMVGRSIQALWLADHVKNLLLKRFELSSRQAKRVKILTFYPLSHRPAQSTMN